ncbi:MAG TPA: AAA family ATPase [Candidatus Methanoperedens sp.]|nr:AAA family ATPase [Candidatus Methanoperedens sp.]
MSYEEFFQLREQPFSNAPDSRYYFNSSQHGEALLRLMHAVRSNAGLAVLVGDIGAGKTTLARRLLDELDEREFESALLVVVHSSISAEWLLRKIAAQLGVEQVSADRVEILAAIYQRLLKIREEGRKAVVLIDEAQMLQSRELMEEFRGLLNLELPTHKLVTFVFFGLPSLDQTLALDEPLRQRVALRYRLSAMGPDTTAAYIRHRLRVAGGGDRDIVRPDALALIHRYARGIPRLVNVICDNCLFEAFLVKKDHVDAAVVAGVAADLGLKPLAAAGCPAGPPASGPPAPEPAPAPAPPSAAPQGPPQRRSTDALLNREEVESLGLLGEYEPG